MGSLGQALVIFVLTSIPAMLLDGGLVFTVLIGMTPGLVAAAVDTHPSRALSSSVLLFNSFGVLYALPAMHKNTSTFADVIYLTLLPSNLVMMFIPAVAGWLVYLVLPPLMKKLLVVREEMKAKAAKKQQATLLQKWGSSLTQKQKKG